MLQMKGRIYINTRFHAWTLKYHSPCQRFDYTLTVYHSRWTEDREGGLPYTVPLSQETLSLSNYCSSLELTKKQR